MDWKRRVEELRAAAEKVDQYERELRVKENIRQLKADEVEKRRNR
jgi:hypothetical protein